MTDALANYCDLLRRYWSIITSTEWKATAEGRAAAQERLEKLVREEMDPAWRRLEPERFDRFGAVVLASPAQKQAYQYAAELYRKALGEG